MQAQAGGHTIKPPAEHHQYNSANRVSSQNIGPTPVSGPRGQAPPASYPKA